MTGAHADGALDNTFGNNYPPPTNGIFTQDGAPNVTIFNDVAAQGETTILVGSEGSDLLCRHHMKNLLPSHCHLTP